LFSHRYPCLRDLLACYYFAAITITAYGLLGLFVPTRSPLPFHLFIFDPSILTVTPYLITDDDTIIENTTPQTHPSRNLIISSWRKGYNNTTFVNAGPRTRSLARFFFSSFPLLLFDRSLLYLTFLPHCAYTIHDLRVFLSSHKNARFRTLLPIIFHSCRQRFWLLEDLVT
jgi:hypothetical protein